MQRTFDRGGNVIIPSFAVGRTQELLYFMREIKAKGLMKGHDNFPVYIDSPLAIEATRIFRDTDASCFDQETRALLAAGVDPITFPGLRVSVTSDESRLINTDDHPQGDHLGQRHVRRGPASATTSSTTCGAKNAPSLFVGYQAVGTRGRALIDGIDGVKLFGEEIDVKAEIAQIGGMSAYADREGLLQWIGSFEPKPPPRVRQPRR